MAKQADLRIKPVTVDVALMIVVILTWYVFQGLPATSVGLFGSYTFGELHWLVTEVLIAILFFDIAERVTPTLIASAVRKGYRGKEVLHWDELARSVTTIAALIVVWLILVLPVESLADALRSWIDPNALLGSYHTLCWLAVAYYAVSGAIRFRSQRLKRPEPSAVSLAEEAVKPTAGTRPFSEGLRPDVTVKKGVVTITGNQGRCSFLVEIPGTSAKLKHEIKVDQDTKNDLLTEYEKTGVLANYLSLVREGLNPPRPTHLHTLDMKAQLRELGTFSYRLLIPRRVADYLQASSDLTHLWIEVDENLLDIPWELMHDQGEFLCMKYAMGRRLLTEEQYASQSNREVERENLSILLIGNPSEDLPQAEREIDILYADLRKMQKTKVTKRVGSEIGKRGFLTALSTGFDVIHYAGHATYDAREPDKSSLRFKDGPCFAYEVRQFLRENAPFIVFTNACSSAREGIVRLANYETRIPSLARAFLYSGVSAYLGSIWPVHDTSAAKFAIQFYRRLIDGHTIGDAIRISRTDIYREGADDEVAWSSFVLYGDPELRLLPPRHTEG